MLNAMASQITDVSIVYSAVCSDADQRKHQSSASIAFVGRIQRWPLNSLHKGPVTPKMFPFDDVILILHYTDNEIKVYWKQNLQPQSFSGKFSLFKSLPRFKMIQFVWKVPELSDSHYSPINIHI